MRQGCYCPYELNVTWYSALNREDAGESLELLVSRFIASRAIALALANVSPQVQQVSYALKELGTSSRAWQDLLSARRFEAADGALAVRLRPYDVVWLNAG